MGSTTSISEVRAGLRYRFGLGRQAPWILVEDRLAYEFFDEYERDGWSNDFRIRGGIAITDQLSVETGYTFDHFAAHDDFLDLQGTQRLCSTDL